MDLYKTAVKNLKIPKMKVAEELTLEECFEIIEKDSMVLKLARKMKNNKIITKIHNHKKKESRWR